MLLIMLSTKGNRPKVSLVYKFLTKIEFFIFQSLNNHSTVFALMDVKFFIFLSYLMFFKRKIVLLQQNWENLYKDVAVNSYIIDVNSYIIVVNGYIVIVTFNLYIFDRPFFQMCSSCHSYSIVVEAFTSSTLHSPLKKKHLRSAKTSFAERWGNFVEEGEFDDGALRDGVGDVEVVGDLEDANGRKPTMKSEKKKWRMVWSLDTWSRVLYYDVIKQLRATEWIILEQFSISLHLISTLRAVWIEFLELMIQDSFNEVKTLWHQNQK